MANATPSVPDQGHRRARGDRAHHRGGRGLARGHHHERSAQLDMMVPAPPSSQTPQQSAEPRAHLVQRDGHLRGRGRGGQGRGRGRGNHQSSTSIARTVHGRAFGGHLTGSDDKPTPRIGADLHANAPEFVPGQSTSHLKEPPSLPSRPKKRRLSKSAAPDLPTRIHEDIANGHYECMICSNEIFRNSKIWDCNDCWSVFHMSCIKKWALSEGSAIHRRQQEGDSLPAPRQWRCPGCNLPKDTMPGEFACWCGKEVDPKSLPGLPPFSCGQTCAREHMLPKDCPHPCSLICHAGPCPPCPQMGPLQPCFCGRESISRKCVDTDYNNGWSCGKICGELMPCGEHVCSRPCHEGFCGACEIAVDARCYCGQEDKAILCCDRGEIKASRRTYVKSNSEQITEEWIASFQCRSLCGRPFDCGAHFCQKPCHEQDDDIPHCPLSPDVITHCPCGKTSLKELTPTTRTKCTDAIHPCNRPCEKELRCGHRCQRVCHIADCPPCTQTVPISCRCGRTALKTICHQGDLEQPQCVRTCKATLNCGRHECGEHCCTGEKKAAERQRRKPRALTAGPPPNDFEAEHICTRICGRLLKCGNHTCAELCHKGPCRSCREAVFDEIACDCGRTVLQPPLPCGTRPPPCPFQCERQRDCGHAQVPHTCHQDDESCPKCPFLTTKSCLCGRNQLKNQPCWRQDVRCGEVCGQKLKCGFHRCRRSCHKPGECEDASQLCQQTCGKQRSCLHPCEYMCHVPTICREDNPCQHKIFITCECQRIKQDAKCGASKSTEGNASKSLKCDEECARLERNRKLALALNIDADSRHDDHIPYQAETLNMYLENPMWAHLQEKELRAFAADPDAKRLRLKPMKRRERAFLHTLAEDFGLDSESMDPEPHRHVALFKTPRFVMAPMKTLAECARIRQTQRAMTQQAANDTAKTKAKASNVVGDPYNAFLISNARFGLTTDEVKSAITPIFAAPGTSVYLDISFLPSEEVVLLPTHYSFTTDRALESHLMSLENRLKTSLLGPPFLGRLQLCRVDDSLNILRREADSAVSGWSQVARAASAPRRAPPPIDGLKPSKNGFAVFETSANKKKKKHVVPTVGAEESVEEDWEVAQLRDEETERLISGQNSSIDSATGSSDEKDADESINPSMAGLDA